MRIGKGVNAVKPVIFLPAQFPQNPSEAVNSRTIPANGGQYCKLLIFLPWHGRGQGFESLQVHQFFHSLTSDWLQIQLFQSVEP